MSLWMQQVSVSIFQGEQLKGNAIHQLSVKQQKDDTVFKIGWKK